jgi:hypothetical protein
MEGASLCAAHVQDAEPPPPPGMHPSPLRRRQRRYRVLRGARAPSAKTQGGQTEGSAHSGTALARFAVGFAALWPRSLSVDLDVVRRRSPMMTAAVRHSDPTSGALVPEVLTSIAPQLRIGLHSDAARENVLERGAISCPRRGWFTSSVALWRCNFRPEARFSSGDTLRCRLLCYGSKTFFWTHAQ